MKLYKQFLFLGLLTLFCFSSFSSADSFTTTANYSVISPENCVGNPTISTSSNTICKTDSSCYNSVDCFGYMFRFPDGGSKQGTIWLRPGDYNISCSSFPCSLRFNNGTYFEFLAPPSPLLPGGDMALSGAIVNITNSVNEFIPYIVYIGVGILLVSILFVGIKWLLNWIRSKTLSPFR